MRAAGVPLFSVEQHMPAVIRRHGLQSVGRARLHQVGQPARPRGRPAARGRSGPDDPWVMAGGHCTFNPEPLADFVDVFALGDGEEIVGEINEALRVVGPPRWARDREELRRSWPASRGSTSRPSTHRLTRRTLVSTLPNRRRVPAEVTKRTVADLADWPYPFDHSCR